MNAATRLSARILRVVAAIAVLAGAANLPAAETNAESTAEIFGVPCPSLGRTTRWTFADYFSDADIIPAPAPSDAEQPFALFEPEPLPALSSDLSDFAPRLQEETQPVGTAFMTGKGMEFSQEAIVRGSVNLPSIKSFQFWGNAYSGSGRMDPLEYDGRIKSNNTGASAGMTIPLGLATLSGFYNYHRDREFFDSKRFEQKDGSYGMAAYMNVGGFYLAASGFYGDDKYSGRGNAAALGGEPEYRELNFKGSQSLGYFETGYEMMSLGLFVLKPFGSYCYTNVRHENIDAASLTALEGKRKYNSCRMTLGSKVDINLAGLDVFTIQARMAWITELRSRAESFSNFCYGRVPGTCSPSSPYFVGNGAGSDFFWGGAGLRLSLWGALSVAMDYDCLYGNRQRLHEGSLGLLFGF